MVVTLMMHACLMIAYEDLRQTTRNVARDGARASFGTADGFFGMTIFGRVSPGRLPARAGGFWGLGVGIRVRVAGEQAQRESTFFGCQATDAA